MTKKTNNLTRRGFLGLSLSTTNVAFGYASPFKTFLKSTNQRKFRKSLKNTIK